ncbi:MAG: AraC family transcriptional regulator, partial [Calditrichaeota bacterium]|nr:AraC family transcriptional regulator [Calditrichota bacterium]
FVNNFRVKEVQARMLDQENSDYTLLAIAMDAGFSSKSSFNRIFKKHTGLTPSQFLADRKSLQDMQ